MTADAGTRYADELSRVREAVVAGRESAAEVAGLAREFATWPTRFVGSGGALAVAELAAMLHQTTTFAPASAMTPLSAAATVPARNFGLVLFSASGRNPDAALTLSSARARGARHLGLVTTLAQTDLPKRLLRHGPTVVTVPCARDGFLATASVVAMSAALLEGYGFAVPDQAALVKTQEWPAALRAQLLVLYPAELSTVARDLETRLSELGLAAVQVADYRSFAHGRHVGFARQLDSTSVVALVDTSSRVLCERTLALLPAGADIHVVESEHAWPASALDLLVRCMDLPLVYDERDPAKPRVQRFGRGLYNMPLAKLLTPSPPFPAERKAAEAHGTITTATFDQALTTWHSLAGETAVGGLVLDYDGTCCETLNRRDPTPQPIQNELSRLLEMGVRVAFASGRGRSLSDELRKWMPPEAWPSVLLGLYNGALVLSLSDEVPHQGKQSPELERVRDRLKQAFPNAFSFELRQHQLTLGPGESTLPMPTMDAIDAVLAREPGIARAVASGHSVDVVAAQTSKSKLVHLLREQVTDSIWAIGDQGSPRGNDFELLAATPFSLSVDRVSADPSRCWNLDTRGESGPALLGRYLRAIKRRRGEVLFQWDDSR